MKKFYIFSGVGILILGLMVWLGNYLASGTIFISTNGQNATITLQKITQGKAFTKIGLNSLSAHVGHGLYTATVKKGLQTSMQIINFDRGHKVFRYTVTTSGLKTVEPVVFRAQDGVASSGQMAYLDTSTEFLSKVDTSNNTAPLNRSRLFQHVVWASASFGLAQDVNGKLFVVNGSVVSQLRVPFNYDGKAISFDVSPNKHIYVSHGEDVYAGSQNGNFKKIYSANSNPVLAAGLGGVAIASGVDVASVKPELSIVLASGKTVKQGGLESGKLAWSPDGKFLVAAGDEEGDADVFSSSLHRIAAIPSDSPINNVVWLNNYTIFYATADSLWRYDLINQRAELIANMPTNNSVVGLNIGSGGRYIYLNTLNNGSGSFAIQRVALRDQPPAVYSTGLQNILPLDLNDCSLSLVNFAGQPIILITKSSDSSLTPQGYLQEAQTVLSQAGFDVNQLQFRLASPAQ